MQTNNLLVMEIKTGKNRKRNPCESVFKNDKSNDKSMDNPASQDLKIFRRLKRKLGKPAPALRQGSLKSFLFVYGKDTNIKNYFIYYK